MTEQEIVIMAAEVAAKAAVAAVRAILGFLSTPSAGRATAKTEKNISAFVSL